MHKLRKAEDEMLLASGISKGSDRRLHQVNLPEIAVDFFMLQPKWSSVQNQANMVILCRCNRLHIDCHIPEPAPRRKRVTYT